MNSPCMSCHSRVMNCHSRCAKYKEFRRLVEEASKREKEARKSDIYADMWRGKR